MLRYLQLADRVKNGASMIFFLICRHTATLTKKGLMSNESSLVLFLAHGESQNLHVKMDKIHDQPGLNCTEC